MSTNGRLPLGEVRAAAAAALQPDPGEFDDLAVLVDVVDSVSPPALMLLWADPWLDQEAMGMGRVLFARLEVRAVAARVEPGPGFTMLERLTSYVLSHMTADAYAWPPASVSAPRVFTINNVPLLAAQIAFRVPVSI